MRLGKITKLVSLVKEGKRRRVEPSGIPVLKGLGDEEDLGQET